jgi:hypothetical protein
MLFSITSHVYGLLGLDFPFFSNTKTDLANEKAPLNEKDAQFTWTLHF